MSFDKEIGGFRYAQTNFGDDLRRVALRELGDASRWVDLVALNELLPPYLTDDISQAGKGVLLTGSTILIPVPESNAAITTDPDAVFGIDAQLYRGEFVFDDGDLSVVSGEQNFVQSIRNRLSTDQRDLMFHPDYGNLTYLLVGKKNGPTNKQLAEFYVRSVLLEDSRVSQVNKVVVDISGDVISIDAEVMAISGKQIQFNVVI